LRGHKAHSDKPMSARTMAIRILKFDIAL
jgi:hypothetical protein